MNWLLQVCWEELVFNLKVWYKMKELNQGDFCFWNEMKLHLRMWYWVSLNLMKKRHSVSCKLNCDFQDSIYTIEWWRWFYDLYFQEEGPDDMRIFLEYHSRGKHRLSQLCFLFALDFCLNADWLILCRKVFNSWNLTLFFHLQTRN